MKNNKLLSDAVQRYKNARILIDLELNEILEIIEECINTRYLDALAMLAGTISRKYPTFSKKHYGIDWQA